LAIGDTNDIHQYVWFNQIRRPIKLGDDAYAIVPSNNYIDVTLVYGRYFTSFEPMPDIEQYRNGVICRRFYLWRLKSYKGMPKTDE
jgi:hypothetical protein